MKYTTLDTNGLPTAFYSDDIHSNIPKEAIKITEDQWLECINNQGQRAFVNGVLGVYTYIPTLTEAKASKTKELETAFQVASKLPVTVGTKTYNGGKESALAIRDYIQLVNDSGGTVYTLWDINNVTATYTLAEAKAIMLAIATPVSQAEFNMNAKKNALKVATTITAVNAVVF